MRRSMRKLIPCNVVMLLIALVGALSLLFMPLISINVGTMMEHLPEAMDALDGETTEGETSAESGWTDAETNAIQLMASVLNTDIEISTFKLGTIATAANPAAKYLTEFVLYPHGFVENMILGSTVTASVIGTATISEEIAQDIDYEALRDILFQLEEEDADVTAIISTYLDTLEEQVGVTVFNDTFDAEKIADTISQAVNEVKSEFGTFSVEKLVCYALTMDAEVDTYEELAELLTAEESGAEGESAEGFAELKEVVGTMATVGSYIGYGFYGMLVLLLPWFLFILLCLLHIFIRNKRCATWYLFTFGWIPCFIFWLVPTLTKLLLPAILGEAAGAALAAVFGAVGSFAWISGICLVVMWFIWLIWMRPLKSRVKAERFADFD